MHLDTHVLVWLHAGAAAELPEPVRRSLETEPLVISPMVELELDFLHEIGRTTQPGAPVIAGLTDTIGLAVSQAPFPAVIRTATTLRWTRDPFDRVICAQALTDRDTLLTRDRRIRANLGAAHWD